MVEVKIHRLAALLGLLAGMLLQSSCVFIGGASGIDVAATEDFHLTVTPLVPASRLDRQYLIADPGLDEQPRTLQLNYAGGTVECKLDTAASYGPCTTSTTYVWAPADYASSATVMVRLTSSSGLHDPIVATFSPATEYAVIPSVSTGLSFITC